MTRRRSKEEVSRAIVIRDLSIEYSLPERWVVWHLISGTTQEEIEAGMREWLLDHGCSLLDKVVIVDNERIYRMGVKNASKAWEDSRDTIEMSHMLSALEDEIAEKGLG